MAQSRLRNICKPSGAPLRPRPADTCPRLDSAGSRLLVSLSCLLLLVQMMVKESAAAEWEGKPVARVLHRPERDGERQLEQSELEGIVTIKPGAPYRAALVSESLERLYAAGRFVDIRADASESLEGVVITFLTKGQYFLGTVRVQGVDAPPSETQLRVATALELGAPLTDDSLAVAIAKMKGLLEDQGYFQAEISWTTQRNADSQQASVVFQVKTGERARLGEVRVSGTPIYPLDRIVQHAEWKRGERVNSDYLQNGLERLRERYQEDGYLQASIDLTRRTYHAETNQVDWDVTVAAGTLVEIVLTGASLSRSQLRDLVPVYQEGSLDEDLLREGERNLGSHFEAEGYFDVAVSTVRHPSGNSAANSSDEKVSIEYLINLGEHHRLRSIQISGNKYFRTEVIAEQMQIQTPRLLSRFGRFSRQLLDRDLARIRALYNENGFAQAEVRGSLRESDPNNKGDIDVLIEVEEGPQTRIGEFAFAGNTAFSEDELRGLINADSGQPFSESMVTADGNHLLTFYLNEGYPAARFRAESEVRETERNLKYILEEGEPSYVANVFIGDLRYTRSGIVNRQVQVRPGEPVSQGRLLDTQRRLYDLGVFSRVDIGLQNPGSQTAQKNVLIYLEEARRYTLKLGLGAEVGRFGGSGQEGETEFSPDVSLAITRLNVGGRPHTAGMRARFSALQRRAGLTYTAPRLFNAPWLTGSLLAFYDETRDVKTFTAKRWEGSLQFEMRRSRATTVLSRYAFRRVSVDENTLRISRDQIPLVSQPVLVGLAGLIWLRDTRDSPGSPRQGAFFSLDLAVAARQFASEASFVRGLIQHSSYYRLPRGLTLVRSSQFGAQTPFGKERIFVLPGAEMSDTPQEIATRAIPISERFFTGGGSTHRGYGLNQAGPRDMITGFAVGGNALLLNTVELRFPVWQSIIGVLFHDMGNVFSSVREISLKSKQDQSSDFSYLTHAIGIGSRYETAVAPIRFDVGYTINPTRFPVVTDTATETRRLSRWQFLFSVGQTF